MAKLNLFDILNKLANDKADIVRLDTMHSANLSGKTTKITMIGGPAEIYKLGGIIGNATHMPVMFLIPIADYEKAAKACNDEPDQAQLIQDYKETLESIIKFSEGEYAEWNDACVRINAIAKRSYKNHFESPNPAG